MQITEHHGVVYLRATPCLKLPINARNSRRSWCVAGFIGCWTSVHINADRFYLANILTFLRQDNGLYHSVDEVEFRWTHKRTHLFWTEGISDIVDVAPWSSVRRLTSAAECVSEWCVGRSPCWRARLCSTLVCNSSWPPLFLHFPGQSFSWSESLTPAISWRARASIHEMKACPEIHDANFQKRSCPKVLGLKSLIHLFPTHKGDQPPLGIEPRTFSLQDWRSATEL